MRQLQILLAIAIIVATLIPVKANAAYEGGVTVYVVEKTSRWTDGNGVHYGFGFLDFGAIEAISIDNKDRWSGDFTWNPSAAGYGDVTSGNIMVIAVVTTDTAVMTDAAPPEGYWFNAYYVDAAAAATPGKPGENETAAGFTHTVFIEEGTETG
jgi:hypothetical protein